MDLTLCQGVKSMVESLGEAGTIRYVENNPIDVLLPPGAVARDIQAIHMAARGGC
jgi:hypothetical protein